MGSFVSNSGGGGILVVGGTYNAAIELCGVGSTSNGSAVCNSRIFGDNTNVGIYTNAGTFNVNNGTKDVLDILTSGNVGIGTASPSAALHVVGTSTTNSIPVVAAVIEGQSSGAPANGSGVEEDFYSKYDVGRLLTGTLQFYPDQVGTGGTVGTNFVVQLPRTHVGGATGTLMPALILNQNQLVTTGGINLGFGAVTTPVVGWDVGAAQSNNVNHAIAADARSAGGQSAGFGAAYDFYATDASRQKQLADISAITTTWSASPTADLAFDLTNSGTVGEKMRITGAGYVGIGTAAPAEPLEIYSSGSGILLQLAGSSGTCNHTPGSSSETVSCSSDMRLKSGVIDTPSALPWLSSIRVRDFTWKSTRQKHTGVIAQELQKTHPEMVTYDEAADQWTVEQPNPWTLVKILQEQQAEIDDLKEQLATRH